MNLFTVKKIKYYFDEITLTSNSAAADSNTAEGDLKFLSSDEES